MILSYGEVIFEITNFKDEDLVTPKEGEREIGIWQIEPKGAWVKGHYY